MHVKDETYVKRGSHRSTESRGFSPVLRFPLRKCRVLG
jgi:hypothetical protein